MTTGRYDRFGLTANPFRDLASESLEDVEIFHVRLQVDESLRTVKEEVLEKENHALVAIVGALGAGKTQRLKLAAAEARDRGAFLVYVDVPSKGVDAIGAIAEGFSKSARLGGFARTFAPPGWLRDLGAAAKPRGGSWDPVRAGKAIGTALSANAPGFLLLNDLHNLTPATEIPAIARMLQAASDALKPGALVMFSCYPNFLAAVVRSFPALGTRINRTVTLPTLTPDEAGLLLAKKLLAKRLVEEIDPLFPFDAGAVAVLNTAAAGNPRRLLEIADRVLEYATDHRTYRVDAGVVQLTLDASMTAPATAPAVPAEAARPPTARSEPSRTPPPSGVPATAARTPAHDGSAALPSASPTRP